MTEEERKQRESARRHFDARDKRLTGDKARLALKWLMTTFPTVFNKQDPKPLKIKCTMDIIGVHKAAGGGIGTGFGINKLKLAIEGWVNTSRYQYALAQPGAKRYDPLTGLPVDAVTSEHMKNAKTRRAGLLRHLKRTKKLTNRPGPHKKSQKPAIQQKVKRDERREKAAQNPKEPTPRGKKKESPLSRQEEVVRDKEKPPMLVAFLCLINGNQ
ncbi:hypothetical protein JCM19237_250 [Photobacterium aphoticum]|uniref:ProQ/FinO domain-containing protein n=1 Tax=Photobacterium aphoticum TaxID=754436 RepID=A0A090QXC8_9GAMM|nr:hypothetical protein JCM19237_250 [Photobacterium aphoticum]